MRVSQIKIREIRTPAIGTRLKKILKDFPPLSLDDTEKVLGSICVKTSISSSRVKSANIFKSDMSHLESWADGFIAASGTELNLISGVVVLKHVDESFSPPLYNDDIHYERIIMFAVVSVDQFIIDLRNLVQVAAVQAS